jgi:23S rRNA (uracil1939-C5)-methyltransferase
MATGSAVMLRIEKLVAGGDGLAFHEGKAVFVPLSLPGERISATITQEKKDFSQAEILEILEPSASRVAPPCGVYGSCGGCNLQHLAYERQLAEKARIVAEAFSRTAKIEAGMVVVRPSPPFEYRNRMQFHFTARKKLGLMRRSSSEVVEVQDCPVAFPTIRTWMAAKNGAPRAYQELKDFLIGKDRFIVFGHREELWLEGRNGKVVVEVAGEEIRFHIKGFFQSNLGLLDAFVPEAVEGLSGSLAADLYCGVGLFGRFLSKSFEKLVCVEHDPYALGLARANVPGRQHEYYAEAMEDWVMSSSARLAYDCVLVDPPRTGLAPAVKQWMARSRIPTIVYVSCDPVTLARDSGDLCRSGYRLVSLKAYDFYPQTSHIECHARFALA